MQAAFYSQSRNSLYQLGIAVLVLFINFGCSEKESSKDKAPQMSVVEKKQQFLDLLVPAVTKTYETLDAQYKDVMSMSRDDPQNELIEKLTREYGASDIEDLLKRIKPHPKSIALAQASKESAWATSRFTKVANNLFGVWSFDKDEPRVAADEKRSDKTIYVKKYDSLEDSVRDYYKVLSTGSAYSEFRDLNMISDDPYELVKKLDKYSEKGAQYGQELSSMISYNKFDEYDQ